LQRKLLLLLMPPYVITSMVIFGCLFILERGLLESIIKDRVMDLSVALTTHLETAGRKEVIQRVVLAQNISAGGGKIYVIAGEPPRILGTTNRKLLGMQVREIGDPAAEELLLHFLHQRKRESMVRLDFFRAIYVSDLQLTIEGGTSLTPVHGALYVELDTSSYYHDLAVAMALQAGTFVGLAIVLGFFSWLAARKLLLRPLRDISGVIHSLETGHDEVAFEEGADDLGILGKQLNVMVHAIRRNQEGMRSILDHFEEMVYVIDVDALEVIFVNRSVREQLGDVVGTTCWKTLYQQDGQCEECAIPILLDSADSASERLVREQFHPILKRWFRIRDQIIPWPDCPQALMQIATDITWVKENEQQLIAARDRALAGERAKADFLSMMSHEVRTPMNGVIGFAHLLAETPLDEEQRSYLDELLSSSEKMVSIMDNILEFSLLSSGKMKIRPSLFSPLALVEEVIREHAVAAAKKHLTLRFAPAGNLPETISADRNHTLRILSHLLGNAVKFSTCGEIVVEAIMVPQTAQNTPAMLEFSVSDEGPGISADVREHLFDAFQQGDSSMTRCFGGTGLGLAFSHRLAAAMGGEILVKSETGKGSKFMVRLPCGQ
jgi:signal transduction histidine kinase